MSDILSRAFILKFLKFGIVGFSGLLVDFGTTYVCKELLKIQKYIANSIGFTVAASTNYILNRVWTFHSTSPNIGLEYTQFLVISLFGLALNNFILWLIISRFKLNFYLSKLIAIGIVTLWNFLANNYYTFAG